MLYKFSILQIRPIGTQRPLILDIWAITTTGNVIGYSGV